MARGPGWVLVDKPAGLLSVPGRDLSLPNALTIVRDQFPEAQAPHRLDMGTSGLLLVATSVEAMRALSLQFRTGRPSKRYAAVVHGEITGDEGVIALPIGRRWEERPKSRVDPEAGKSAETKWWVADRGAGRTRLDLVPITGRTHQLRVHLSAIGHPIVGDELYGPPDAETRMMLHACHLSFDDPSCGARLSFDSVAPF